MIDDVFITAGRQGHTPGPATRWELYHLARDTVNTYGFGWRTSSYVAGPCNTTFSDANYTTYPGHTGAGASPPTMSSGWDNRITYIDIY